MPEPPIRTARLYAGIVIAILSATFILVGVARGGVAHTEGESEVRFAGVTQTPVVIETT